MVQIIAIQKSTNLFLFLQLHYVICHSLLLESLDALCIPPTSGIKRSDVYMSTVKELNWMSGMDCIPASLLPLGHHEHGLSFRNVSLWAIEKTDSGYFQPIASATVYFVASNLCCSLVEGPLQEVRRYRSQIERHISNSMSTSDNQYS